MVGVCAGDFDGDLLPDLFSAYPYGGHRLYRNLGDFRFEDVTEKSGLTKIVADHWAVGCCFVDHDGDGDLDLFVAVTVRSPLGHTVDKKLTVSSGLITVGLQ